MVAGDYRPTRSLIPALCLLLAFFAADCATTSQPEGWLSPVDAQDSLGYGGWARAWLPPEPGAPARKDSVVQGELIAVSPDTVYLLSNDTLLHSVPVSAIERLGLTAYDANAVPLNLWYIGGALLTPAHGWFAVFELPLWVLVGGIATLTAPNVAEFEWSEKPWAGASRFARFPQGMPGGLDRSILRPKGSHATTAVATKK